MGPAVTEHLKAKAWRLANQWTMDDLAELTGFSKSAIMWFERGQSSDGSTVDPFAWHRYRRVCHSVDVEHVQNGTSRSKGVFFKW